MDAIRNGMAIPQSMSRGGNHRRRGSSDVILSRYVDLDEYGEDDDVNDDDSSSISSTGASTAAPTPSSSTLSSDDEGNGDDSDSDCASENAPTSPVRM